MNIGTDLRPKYRVSMEAIKEFDANREAVR